MTNPATGSASRHAAATGRLLRPGAGDGGLTRFAPCDAQREIAVLRDVPRHPNLMDYKRLIIAGNEVHAVRQLMRAGTCLSLLDLAQFSGGLPETFIVYILYHVLRSLAHLHAHHIIHRSVKAGNILLDHEGAVKLQGLHTATSLVQNGVVVRKAHEFAGIQCAIPWTAPEVLAQDLEGYDTKADVYSVGITALELAAARVPYGNMPPTKVCDRRPVAHDDPCVGAADRSGHPRHHADPIV